MRDTDRADPMSVTSTHLLQGLRDAGNAPVWREFVARYAPLLHGYARRHFGMSEHDAEEVSQEVLLQFAEAYRNGRYDRDKGQLRKWLFGIALNCMRDARRRHARRRELIGIEAESGLARAEELPDDAQLEHCWEEEWQRSIYRTCLAEVSRRAEPRTVEAFQLFAVQGLPADEVARRLGMSRNAVFLAKYKMIVRIRECLPVISESW
jgi:RNA polymerase sigma-70 factor (ECF subfamily)